jgi:hypothetical protein
MAKKNDVCRCIARVYRWGALRPHRCSNPVWKDGYCKTHQQSAHAAIAEKDKEIERLTEELESHSWEISPAMAQKRIDTLWEENKRLERDILMLVRLCLSNGIISRGLACEHLGCAREDLDGILDQIATEAGEDGSDEIRNYSK